jgi:DNA-binding GntR family transcriptional regulator
MQLQLVTDEALSMRVANVLKDAIITMQLQAGQALVERQIALQMGISTTPVRQAIRQLANEGLVTIASNRSAVVRALTPKDIEEIYTLRVRLEPLAIRLAVAHDGDNIIPAVEEILARSTAAVEADDIMALAACNREFNDALIRGCGNSRLLAILQSLHTQTQQIGTLAWKYRRSAPLDHEQHLRIVDAARRGAWDELDVAVSEHLRSAQHEYMLAFAEYQAEQSRLADGATNQANRAAREQAAPARSVPPHAPNSERNDAR